MAGAGYNEVCAKAPFAVWHDRAVFHFLTDAADRSSYVKAMSGALNPGSHAIVATFDLDGPEKCSGLDIVRYSPETMSEVFGDDFKLVETQTEKHTTPGGASQSFVYCRFKEYKNYGTCLSRRKSALT